MKVDGEVKRVNSTLLTGGQNITLILEGTTTPDAMFENEREKRILSQVCSSCRVLKSTDKFAIVQKPCGVGMDLARALPFLLPTALKPTLVLPLDKAADGLVVCSNCNGVEALNGFHVSLTYTLLVVCELSGGGGGGDASNLTPPREWPGTRYTCKPVGTPIHSNTDGLIRVIQVSIAGRFEWTRKNHCDILPTTTPTENVGSPLSLNQYDVQLKTVLSAAKQLSWPVLGNSSSICARRRCSAGRGLFASLTHMNVTDPEGMVTCAEIPMPTKFEALRTRETRFYTGTACSAPTTDLLPSPPFAECKLCTFSGLPIYVNSTVMKPCKSSMALVDTALKCLQNIVLKLKLERTITVVDAGTGSGCLLLSFLSQLPAMSSPVRGVGLDISPAALSTATYNTSINKLSKFTEYHVCEFKNMGSFFLQRYGRNSVDMIICNPPYHAESKFHVGPSAESRRNDPGLALWGSGSDGLGCYVDIAKGLQDAPALRVGCVVILEVPSEAAAKYVSDLFAEDQEFVEEEKVHVPQKSGEIQLLRAVVYRKMQKGCAHIYDEFVVDSSLALT